MVRSVILSPATRPCAVLFIKSVKAVTVNATSAAALDEMSRAVSADTFSSSTESLLPTPCNTVVIVSALNACVATPESNIAQRFVEPTSSHQSGEISGYFPTFSDRNDSYI